MGVEIGGEAGTRRVDKPLLKECRKIGRIDGVVAVEVRAAAGEAFGLKKACVFCWLCESAILKAHAFRLPVRLVYGVARPLGERLSPIHRD